MADPTEAVTHADQKDENNPMQGKLFAQKNTQN